LAGGKGGWAGGRRYGVGFGGRGSVCVFVCLCVCVWCVYWCVRVWVGVGVWVWVGLCVLGACVRAIAVDTHTSVLFTEYLSKVICVCPWQEHYLLRFW